MNLQTVVCSLSRIRSSVEIDGGEGWIARGRHVLGGAVGAPKK